MRTKILFAFYKVCKGIPHTTTHVKRMNAKWSLWSDLIGESYPYPTVSGLLYSGGVIPNAWEKSDLETGVANPSSWNKAARSVVPLGKS